MKNEEGLKLLEDFMENLAFKNINQRLITEFK